jgi:hypothetical protein
MKTAVLGKGRGESQDQSGTFSSEFWEILKSPSLTQKYKIFLCARRCA